MSETFKKVGKKLEITQTIVKEVSERDLVSEKEGILREKELGETRLADANTRLIIIENKLDEINRKDS